MPIFGLFGGRKERPAPARRYYIHETKRAAQAAMRRGDVLINVRRHSHKYDHPMFAGWYAGPPDAVADAKIQSFASAIWNARQIVERERAAKRQRREKQRA